MAPLFGRAGRALRRHFDADLVPLYAPRSRQHLRPVIEQNVAVVRSDEVQALLARSSRCTTAGTECATTLHVDGGSGLVSAHAPAPAAETHLYVTHWRGNVAQAVTRQHSETACDYYFYCDAQYVTPQALAVLVLTEYQLNDPRRLRNWAGVLRAKFETLARRYGRETALVWSAHYEQLLGGFSYVPRREIMHMSETL